MFSWQSSCESGHEALRSITILEIVLNIAIAAKSTGSSLVICLTFDRKETTAITHKYLGDILLL